MKYRLLILFTILFLLLAWHLNTITEDAYISFRYAWHFAEGLGFRWNPGDPPVEGFTNFMWTMILAGMHILGLDMEITSRILGLIFAVSTLVVVWCMAGRYCSGGRWWKYTGAVFLALSPPFVSWASSGLETTMFTFLVTLGIFLYFIFYETGKYRFLWSVILLSAALTRPEGLLFFIILAIHLLITQKFNKNNIITLLPFIVPFILFEIWRIIYFGEFLPNIFYAKTGFTSAMFLRGLKYTLKFFLVTAVPILGILTLFRLRKPWGLILTICALYCFYVIAVGGDYMHYFRFFVPIMPLMALLAGEGFNRLREKKAVLGYSIGIILTALMIFGAFYPFGIKPSAVIAEPKPLYYIPAKPMLMFERYQAARLKLLGETFAGVQRPGESMATSAIGIIGYVTELNIYDFHGLTDPYVAKRRNPNMGKGDPAHEKLDFAYTISLKPTYVMFTREFKHFPMDRMTMLHSITGVGVWGDINTGYNISELDSILADYEVINWRLNDEVNGETGYYPFFARKGRFHWEDQAPYKPQLPLKPPHGIPEELPEDWEKIQKERMKGKQ